MEQKEADAARRSLQHAKEVRTQAYQAQAAAFNQTLADAKTKSAQVLVLA